MPMRMSVRMSARMLLRKTKHVSIMHVYDTVYPYLIAGHGRVGAVWPCQGLEDRVVHHFSFRCQINL